jgi:EpsI family protein
MVEQVLSGRTRRDALLGGAMLLTAAVAWARTPTNRVVAIPHGDIGEAIPVRVGSWGPAPGGDVVLPPDDEQAAAKIYEDQVMRTFVRGDDSAAIMFVLAYDRSQSGMLMVHRPESCYPGSGFTITADQAVAIPLNANLAPHGRYLSTQRDERIEQVLYWTRLGNEFPSSWDEERQFLAFQNLRGLSPDGALVRLSMIDSDPEGAKVRLTRFAAELYAASSPAGRALLGGPASVSAGTA